jgi:hypothetical protein
LRGNSTDLEPISECSRNAIRPGSHPDNQVTCTDLWEPAELNLGVVLPELTSRQVRTDLRGVCCQHVEVVASRLKPTTEGSPIAFRTVAIAGLAVNVAYTALNASSWVRRIGAILALLAVSN